MTGFLRTILGDASANMLAIGAASIIPLVGVIGGGVDASRMYLAKSRLQQSCDAATLAARKKLAGGTISGTTIPAEIQTTADNFFDSNYPAGMYGTTDVDYTLTAGTATRMDGAATAAVPTTMMKVFGIPQVDLAVSCSAELNLPNVDVVLVLDMSGSMKGSRITALQNAVFSFYDEVMGNVPDGAQVRIGIVPYSGAVNVGGMLTGLKASTGVDYIADSWTYQSREALFKKVSNNDGINIGDVIDESWTIEILPREAVQLASSNSGHYHWNKNNDVKKADCLNYNGAYTVGDYRWEVSNATWLPDYWGDDWPNNQKAACGALVHKTKTAGPGDVRAETYTDVFDKYRYKSFVLDTSAFKTGASVTTPTGTKGANVSSKWNGCIEERQTVAATSFSPIPENAHDLDIDLVPDASRPETQWYPMWPQITFDRGGPAVLLSASNKSTRGFNCPRPSVKLTEYPMTGTARDPAFEKHIKGLVPEGGTMHDIGMIWAGRMISPDGIFAGDNASARNGDPISRHIIFMTDGEMGASPSNTTSYGNYDMDGRFAGFHASGTWSETQLAAIHNKRLAAVCERIRNKNVTIWSVAFGLPHNGYTRGCATGGATRAFTAANASELDARFRQIAGSIAELRLVQ